MTKKEKIESLVLSLEGKNEKEIVKILQEIGIELLNKYVIEVDNIIIEPVLVEAYYFDATNFRDCNTYGACDLECRKKQSNRFNQLFIHPKKYSAGIDIVLSKGDYCLSYLIKNSLIHYNGETKFYSQEKLAQRLSELLKKKYPDIENINEVLKIKGENDNGLQDTNYKGLFAKRKGTSKGEYADIETACVLLDRINRYKYSFEKGYSKTKLLEDYIKNNSNIDKEKIGELCKGLINKEKLEKLLSE